MSEGQSFEQNQEIPPQPRVDVKTILEQGEIIHSETLKGYECYEVVSIKDDGKALFREGADKIEAVATKRRLHRNDLEVLAANINEALGFNLVPPVARRSLNGKSGTLQQFVDNAKIANHFLDEDWLSMVDRLEFIKAAVFDYLIDAKDRGCDNFLIDKDARKIWLIDHDYYMMGDAFNYGSDILRTAIYGGLTVLPEEIIKALQGLLEKIDSIIDETAKPKIKEIVAGIKNRTETLIATRTLKAQ